MYDKRQAVLTHHLAAALQCAEAREEWASTANVAYRSGNEKKATKLFQRSRRLMEMSVDHKHYISIEEKMRIGVTLGDAALRLGDLDNAEIEYRTALKAIDSTKQLDENSTIVAIECNSRVASVYSMKGDKKRQIRFQCNATHMIETATQKYSDNSRIQHMCVDHYFDLAVQCRSNGEYENARKWYSCAKDVFEAMLAKKMDVERSSQGVHRLDLCIDSCVAMGPLEELKKTSPDKLLRLLTDRAWELIERGRLSEVESVVDEIVKVDGDGGSKYFNGAVMLCNLIRYASHTKSSIPNSERDLRAIALRAVEFLKFAVRDGYKDIGVVSSDRHFECLSHLKEYRDLVGQDAVVHDESTPVSGVRTSDQKPITLLFYSLGSSIPVSSVIAAYDAWPTATALIKGVAGIARKRMRPASFAAYGSDWLVIEKNSQNTIERGHGSSLAQAGIFPGAVMEVRVLKHSDS